ncbi:unnamed protein product [Ambrosiozyma monospora]|uniref:Unnamed protein product n=1 Tax=Ambrosiozyma monospora TaxID=43982 RepID=A0A9W6YVF7_AMBMO|nr:unnamed protein product [Ambrosiozyma monospora]
MSFFNSAIRRAVKSIYPKGQINRRVLFSTNTKHITKSNPKFSFKLMGLTLFTIALPIFTSQTILNDSKKYTHLKVIIIEDEDNDEEDEEKEETEKYTKPPLSSMKTLSDFEPVAKAVLPSTAYSYYSTGSQDEITMTENRSIFDRVKLIPQIRTGTKSDQPDLSTLFFPQQIKFDAPFYITAFAGSRAAHEQAEYNLVNAAHSENVPYMIPIRLSVSPLRDFAKICAERDQFSMNQIYFDSRDQVDQFPKFLKSVEEDKEKETIEAVSLVMTTRMYWISIPTK